MANPKTVTTAAEVNGNQRLTNSPSLRQFGHEFTGVNRQKAYGDQNRRQASTEHNPKNTAVRLKVEQNQLVGVFGEIGVLVDALKGA
jgi:hypothetical protein